MPATGVPQWTKCSVHTLGAVIKKLTTRRAKGGELFLAPSATPAQVAAILRLANKPSAKGKGKGKNTQVADPHHEHALADTRIRGAHALAFVEQYEVIMKQVAHLTGPQFEHSSDSKQAPPQGAPRWFWAGEPHYKRNLKNKFNTRIPQAPANFNRIRIFAYDQKEIDHIHATLHGRYVEYGGEALALQICNDVRDAYPFHKRKGRTGG